MNSPLVELIQGYNCKTQEDYANALKEIMQDIALLGLWRSKFFEHAAFYGGTALRILYQLDRFSEDLDFTLLKQEPEFSLVPYLNSLKLELESYGLEVQTQEKVKSKESVIHSAFLKANTKEHTIRIGAPQRVIELFQLEENTKVKLEVDTTPCEGFITESKSLFRPIPFFVRTLDLPSLFAGKLHAVLCRDWGKRVKGRDWYDLLWFARKNVQINYQYLDKKLRQTGHFSHDQSLSKEVLKQMLLTRVKNLDISRAKEDVFRFISDPRLLEAWSSELFVDCIEKITNK